MNSSLHKFSITKVIRKPYFVPETTTLDDQMRQFLKKRTHFALVVVDWYFQYVIGTNLIGFEYNNNRLSSLFGDELILGNFLSRLFPLLFALVTLTVSGSKRYIYLTLILFIASDVLIYISGERTAFLLLLLSTLIIIVSITRWQQIRVFSFQISLLIIFLII